MKSYSKVNILGNALRNNVEEGKGFFSTIFKPRAYLTIIIPYYDFLRGRVFIEDLRDIYEGVPYSFQIDKLLYILYDDFLAQVKRGMASSSSRKYNEQVAAYLLSGKNDYYSSLKETVIVPINEYQRSYAFKEAAIERTEDEKKAHITIAMREAEVMRGEILLSDISQCLTEEILLEELIGILYLNFIANIKENGNIQQVQKMILENIS